jgi:hypothetical protein
MKETNGRPEDPLGKSTGRASDKPTLDEAVVPVRPSNGPDKPKQVRPHGSLPVASDGPGPGSLPPSREGVPPPRRGGSRNAGSTEDVGISSIKPTERAPGSTGHSEMPDKMPDEIPVAVYVDTNDAGKIAVIVRRVDELVDALGYERPENDHG